MKLKEILESILEEKGLYDEELSERRKCKKRKKKLAEFDEDFEDELIERRKCKKRKKKLMELDEYNVDELFDEIDEILEAIEMLEEDELDDDEIEELEEAIDCLDEEIIEMINEAIETDEEEIDEALYLNKTPMSVRAKARKYARSSKGKLARKRYLKKLRKFKQRIEACKKRGLTFSLRQMKCVKPRKRRG